MSDLSRSSNLLNSVVEILEWSIFNLKNLDKEYVYLLWSGNGTFEWKMLAACKILRVYLTLNGNFITVHPERIIPF